MEISIRALKRTLTSSTINPLKAGQAEVVLNLKLTQQHQNTFTLMLYNLLSFFYDDNRDNDRKSLANNFAEGIEKIPSNKDDLHDNHNDKFYILNDDKHTKYVTIEKEIKQDPSNEPNEFYVIKAYQVGLFGTSCTELVRISSNNYVDSIQQLKKCAKDYLEDQSDLFAPVISANRTGSPENVDKPAVSISEPAGMVCIIGGSNVKTAQLEEVWQTQPNDELKYFDGCNSSGTDAQNQVNRICESLVNLPQERRVVSLSASGTGCYIALEVARKLPDLKFKLILNAPTDGDIGGRIFKLHTIPANVTSAIIDYPEIEDKGSHSILYCESATTLTSVNFIKGASSQSVKYDLNFISKHKIEKNERAICLRGGFNKESLRNGSNQKKIYNEIERLSNGFNNKLPNSDIYSIMYGKISSWDNIDGGKLTYPNGDIYKGVFADSMPEGRGTLTLANGIKVKGNFENGKIKGEAKITFPNGDKFFGTVDEEFNMIKGRLTYKSNGKVADGTFENNMPDDVYIYDNINDYNSKQENISINKFSIVRFKRDGTVQDKCSGVLTHGFDEYDGDFIDGEIVNGTLVLNKFVPEGSRFEKLCYIGNFHQGKMHDNTGRATLTNLNNDWTYTGRFNNDQMVSGKFKYKDGRVYTGKFSNDGIQEEQSDYEINEMRQLHYHSKKGMQTKEISMAKIRTKAKVTSAQNSIEEGELIFSNIEPKYKKYVGKFKDGKMHDDTGILFFSTTSRFREYSGNFDNDLMNGTGLLKLRNGDSYNGIFNNGTIESGILIFDINNSTYLEYKGQFNKNLEMHGQGTLTYKDGRVFTGQFENGRIKSGTLTGNDQSKYVSYTGGFNEKGERHGEGTLIYKDGRVFTGTFENGVVKSGTLTPNNQSKHVSAYNGDFNEKGERHGKGKLTYKDGKVFTGQFENGVKKSGTITYPENSKYKEYSGKFNDKGQFHDKSGKLTLQNGDIYDVVLENGIIKSGTLTFNAESPYKIYRGEFNEGGEMHGQGVLLYKNVIKFIGTLDEGKLKEGILYNIDTGEIYEGKFTNNLFTGTYTGDETKSQKKDFVLDFLPENKNLTQQLGELGVVVGQKIGSATGDAAQQLSSVFSRLWGSPDSQGGGSQA